MNLNTPYISDPTQQRILTLSMHGRMRYTLMNDFLSKYSLQNDLYALSGLVAALLRIPVETITSIEILNPVAPADNMNDKTCILDLKLELNHESIINVEIQSKRQDFWPERSITYLCRNFDQLKAGESYRSIQPCIQIGILSHNIFSKEDPRYTEQFLSTYRLLNLTTHTEYSRKFEIRVLLLNQLENATEEDRADPNGVYHWAKLFRASTWEELMMAAKDNPRMESFVGTVRQLSADEKIAQACEARRRYSIEIATYEQDVEQAKRAAEEAKAQVDQAKAQANDFKAQADDFKAQADDFKAQADDFKAQADDFKAQADDFKAQAALLKKQNDEKDALIAMLQAQIKKEGY